MKNIFQLAIFVFLNSYAFCSFAQMTQAEAKDEGRGIWMSGCLDYKNGLLDGDFAKWFKLDSMVKNRNDIKRNAVIRLYSDGWDTAKYLHGVIDCNNQAAYSADTFTSGIDIRP
ncbi:hypothetical protein SOM41_22330 [Enterobacter sp. CFBP8995]|nr:hypothetical protein [Enterobacter sp. CFBP8995]